MASQRQNDAKRQQHFISLSYSMTGRGERRRRSFARFFISLSSDFLPKKNLKVDIYLGASNCGGLVGVAEKLL